jgi:serine protease
LACRGTYVRVTFHFQKKQIRLSSYPTGAIILSEELWYNPIDVHGTHVAGTIVAEGGNGEGVVGVIPSNKGICLLIARVFDDFGLEDASASTVVAGVEWCANNGARVINLSLGSSEPDFASLFMVQHLVNEEGIVIVAAAGNDGNSSLNYPASYKEVISVAAVDQKLKRAVFSSYGGQIDVSAPGVGVNSTIPNPFVLQDNVGGLYETSLVGGTAPIRAQLSGSVSDCGQGLTPCPKGNNSFCLLMRGASSFVEKTVNAQRSGCLAAVLYNNRSFPEDETLVGAGLGPSSETIRIPVVGLSYRGGTRLLTHKSATLYRDNSTKGYYGLLQGTSMAAPHVTGVVSKIWAARPKCTNKQVREAIEKTAKDIDAPGKDENTGYGLVQTRAAYQVSEIEMGGLVVDFSSNSVLRVTNLFLCFS